MVHVNTEHDLAPIVPICEEIKKKPAADYDPCRFQLNVFEMASGVVSHKNVTKVVGCIYVQLGSLNDSMSMVSGVRLNIGVSEIGWATTRLSSSQAVAAASRRSRYSEYGRHPSSLKLGRAKQGPTLLAQTMQII